jgi:molybdopterin-guanine dinucleotide biosynthesis protein
MNVFHVVGWQGTGKSTLISMMVDVYTSRGAVCASVMAEESRELGGRDAIVRAHPHASFLFIEHYPNAPLDVAPGDTVIKIEIAGA